MTLSLKQLVRRGFTTRQAQALIENTPEVKAFPEHFANPTGDVAGLTAVGVYLGEGPPEAGWHYPIWAALVTTTAPYQQGSHDEWYLNPADSQVDWTTLDEITNVALNGVIPPGVYLAVNIMNAPFVPTALPDGWTAGNTTGAGPVLPFMGESNGYDYYAGLVSTEGGPHGIDVGETAGWFLKVPTATLTTNPQGDNAPDDVPGVYLAAYYTATGAPAPTEFPPGWSFQPYGVGAAGPVLAALGEAVKPKEFVATIKLLGSGPGSFQRVTLVEGENNIAFPGSSWIAEASSTWKLQIEAPHFSQGTLRLDYAELDVTNANGSQRISVGLDAGRDMASDEGYTLVADDTSERGGAGTDLSFAGNGVVTAAGGMFFASCFLTLIATDLG